jgi:hypothetical protein
LISTETVCSSSRISHQYSRKIALVHHHPLPIPHTESDNFLLLRKGGTFIEALMRQGVDVILHGHKHNMFFSRVTYRLGDQDAQIAVMIGAGSATRNNVKSPNSYNVFEVSQSKIDLDIRESRGPGSAFQSNRRISVLPTLETTVEEFNTLSGAFGYRQQSVEAELEIKEERDCDSHSCGGWDSQRCPRTVKASLERFSGRQAERSYHID